MAELRCGNVTHAAEGPRESDREVAAAIDAYLKLANGDLRLALAVSVADGIAVSKLVSTGFARWRQPRSRRGA
ncbi:hypothetical protein [Enterovirga aerilata]|uniref:Uncharacterized protein n=1 Tax=Enterovirga aerilata TaxID=2730920 RepID=A0A849IDT9_9HYPH|nr:hypothetical protein [Enterovirga sp. DB1703]NNM74609.1 hypothetical protein [Enterovirga sp. DB1703]